MLSCSSWKNNFFIHWKVCQFCHIVICCSVCLVSTHHAIFDDQNTACTCDLCGTSILRTEQHLHAHDADHEQLLHAHGLLVNSDSRYMSLIMNSDYMYISLIVNSNYMRVRQIGTGFTCT